MKDDQDQQSRSATKLLDLVLSAEDERVLKLMEFFRRASPRGRDLIMRTALRMRNQHPAPRAV